MMRSGPTRRQIVPDTTVGIWKSRLPANAVVGAVAVALVAGALAFVQQRWHPDLDMAALRSAMETTITLFALVGAVVLATRFQRTHEFRDLLLMIALATSALSAFGLEAVPAFDNEQTQTFGVGGRLACALVVTGALLAATVAPAGRRIATGRGRGLAATCAGIAVVVLGELIDVIVGPGGPHVSANAYYPLPTILVLISSCGLLVAGYGFAARAGDKDDESVAPLLAGACYVLAVASLVRVAQPMPPADWVTPPEFFTVLGYGLLFAAALRLYGGSGNSQEAVRAERIRIAHDLHDSLAQDLAFIVACADRLEHRIGEGPTLRVAARRALDASRGTIVDLEARRAPTTAAALEEVAAELGTRFATPITVKFGADEEKPEPTASDRREIVRIAREAIVNAVKHGGAQNVVVTFGSSDSQLLLRISDDGCGVGHPAASAAAGTKLGIGVMRARARRLGGRLSVRSGDGGGTEVDVIAGAHSRVPGA